MAFWETVKVWQLGELLRKLEQPEVAAGWQPFIDSLNRRGWEQSQDFKTEVSTLPKYAAGYLLTLAAALCEAPNPADLEHLAESYHLDQIVRDDQGHDLAHYLSSIIPLTRAACGNQFDEIDIGDPNYKNVMAPIALERIQNHYFPLVNSAAELGALMDQVESSNQAAYDQGYGRPEKRMKGSIDMLRSRLNEWDAQLQRLCEQHCTTPPQPDVIPEVPADTPQAEPEVLADTPEAEKDDVDLICEMIENGVQQIILTGAPGTGKTFTAQCVAGRLGRHQITQFHPSYDYTDFVEGLRPVQLEGDDKTAFVRVDGSFKAFCRMVAEKNRKNYQRNGESYQREYGWTLPRIGGSYADPSCIDNPEHKYVFIIDEINRANLSQVFGELMFCIEPGKRGMTVDTQYATLPSYRVQVNQATKERKILPCPNEDDVFVRGFFVPKNVIIIGTMNDIDRSVESMDFALRRRFVWHEVKVTAPKLMAAFRKEPSEPDFPENPFSPVLRDSAKDAADRIIALNDVIRAQKDFGLNRHYDIAQGQFSHIDDPDWTLDDLFQFVWDWRIKFLLREYVRGEDPKEVKKFINECAAALGVTETDDDD